MFRGKLTTSLVTRPLAATAVVAGLSLGAGAVAAQAADEAADGESGGGSVVIVVDASGSMDESSGRGGSRMDAAKEGLTKVIAGLPEGSDVGLRLYGASIEDGVASCEDSQLVVPVDGVDTSALTAAVRKLEPLGNTPIAYSLLEAADDLKGMKNRTIVLVSDGEENCNGDPCEVARDISDSGTNLKVDTIGLQVDAASRHQLSCIANASGGTYYDVPDVVNLPNTIERTAVRAARGYSPVGRPIEGGTTAANAAGLIDGQWLDNIGDSGTEYYEVPDPGEGAVHVAATIRPTALGTADQLGVEISVTSASGTECARAEESGIGAFSGSSPVTATLSIVGDVAERCGEGPYTVAVDSPVGSEQPLVVWLFSEPGVESVDGLPASVELENWAPEKGQPFDPDPLPVEGSRSHTDAPMIEPGTYTDTLLAGELLYYRVEVDWGESLVCQAKVAPKPELKSSLSEFLRAQTYGFNGGEILNTSAQSESDLWTPSDGAEVIATTQPVRYRNRETNYKSNQGSMVAGAYYCAFRVGVRESAAAEIGDLALTINVSTSGTAGEGKPDYLAQPASATEAEDDIATGDDGGSNLAFFGVMAAGLVAVLAAFAWFFRRMRRT